MGVTKLVFCFICCILVGTGLSAAIPIDRSSDHVQKLEHRIEELTEELKLLKEESFHHRSRRATTEILNKNRKFKLILHLIAIVADQPIQLAT